MIQDIFARYLYLSAQYPKQAQIGRFLFSGALSLGTDLVFLYLFTDIFGIWYLASAVAAFIIAFFVSFSLHKFWTFGDRSRDGVHLQLGAFLFVAVVNLILNTVLVYAFVEWMGVFYLLSQIIASALIAIESFFIYQRVIFNKI